MAYEAYESITVDVDDGVATLQFHRPEKLNALNTAVMHDVRRAFDEIQLDRSVDVVVLEGEGEEAFSAGADIREYAGDAEDHDPRQKDRQDLFYDIYRQPYDCHATTVAKIDGWAVGGGLILALYCDMRVATADSSFGVPTCNIGQIPTGGATYRAVQLVGEAKAKELVLTAGFVDAAEAHRIGLVNRVADDADALDAEVERIVDAIQDTGRQAVKNSKRALNRAANAESLDEARAFERDVWWEQFDSAERERLVDEFLEE